MAEGISAREFARLDGCSDTLVRRAVKRGKLKAHADGSLDRTQVGSPWRKTNRNASAANTDVPEKTVRTGRASIAEVSSPSTLAAAELLKEQNLAKLRQLEYDTKSGLVVPVSEVARIVGAKFAHVRSRLLAIPAEAAPGLARLKTPAEIQDALQAAVVAALEELSLERISGSV